MKKINVKHFISNIIHGESRKLFEMNRIPKGYVATINGTQRDHIDQRMATITWTVVHALLLVMAIRALLPGVMYMFASAGLHMTIGTEAHDMLAGCLFDICRAIKDIMIKFTWMGGFLDAIAEYNFVQCLIAIVCASGCYKAVCGFVYACCQCKKHFGKNVNQSIPFSRATISRHERRTSHRDRHVG